MLSHNRRWCRAFAALPVVLASAAVLAAAPAGAEPIPPTPAPAAPAPAAASPASPATVTIAVANGHEAAFTRPGTATTGATRTGPAAPPPTDPAAVSIPDGATVPSLAGEALVQLALFRQSGSSAAETSLGVLRAQIATLVAAQLGREPAPFEQAWSSADLPHQTALLAAFSQIGVPYRTRQSKAGVGFDCSGLTYFAWGVAGLTIPRSSGTQLGAAAPRTAETAIAGDLVYYPGHVMMYLGVPGTMVHSPYTGRDVEVDDIPAKRINTVKYGDPTQ